MTKDLNLVIDMLVRKNTEHAKEEFQRRKKISFWNNFAAYVATPEDVILKKLAYYREGGSEKHLRDIRGILTESKIDFAYLDSWVAKLKLEDEWKKCQS